MYKRQAVDCSINQVISDDSNDTTLVERARKFSRQQVRPRSDTTESYTPEASLGQFTLDFHSASSGFIINDVAVDYQKTKEEEFKSDIETKLWYCDILENDSCKCILLVFRPTGPNILNTKFYAIVHYDAGNADEAKIVDSIRGVFESYNTETWDAAVRLSLSLIHI